MKYLNIAALILNIIFISLSYSMGDNPLRRSFSDRTYRFAEDTDTNQPIGKIVYRWCIKYKVGGDGDSTKCDIWGTDLHNICEPKTFYSLRAAEFVVIQKSRIN